MVASKSQRSAYLKLRIVELVLSDFVNEGTV